MLTPAGVNSLRSFAGRGHLVWGARTTSLDPEWRYVNVRRFFLHVRHSLERGLEWVVFEPNDEPLWARVRLAVGNFLAAAWRSGALVGTKQEEAFFVRCDRSTMSAADLSSGRLVVQVGLAMTKPAEFLVFRLALATA
jgi:phage tail sheath protein FI